MENKKKDLRQRRFKSDGTPLSILKINTNYDYSEYCNYNISTPRYTNTTKQWE